MSRRLPGPSDRTVPAVVVAVWGLCVVALLSIYVAANEPRPAPPSPSPAPVVATVPEDYVYTGPMTWTYQGAEVSVPGLAEDIADSCADTPELLDCVGAIVGQRMEHRP